VWSSRAATVLEAGGQLEGCCTEKQVRRVRPPESPCYDCPSRGCFNALRIKSNCLCTFTIVRAETRVVSYSVSSSLSHFTKANSQINTLPSRLPPSTLHRRNPSYGRRNSSINRDAVHYCPVLVPRVPSLLVPAHWQTYRQRPFVQGIHPAR
jgi:hypothetical protein